MGCICPKGRSGDDAEHDYVEFGNYVGEKNCCGQKSGRGQYYYDNGDMYDGMWKRNKKHGYGVYTYRDGKRLEGFFENDQFLGSELPPDLVPDEDHDDPLPRNAGSGRSEDERPMLSEELIQKKERREIRKQEHQERIEEMKKKYGIH